MSRQTAAVLVWFFLWVPCSAQTLGTITGEVKDSSGAIIPGVTVTATNTATNATREGQSNPVGAYSFPALPPGRYTVRAELQGFQTATRTAELHVEQTLRLDFSLAIGTLSETPRSRVWRR